MDPAIFDDLGDHRSSGEQTSEGEESTAQLLVFYSDRPPMPYKLHQGVNVVGRQSSFAQRDALRLHQWSTEYPGSAVHGIFLEGSSVSSAHAVIYLDGYSEACYVKDLKSRNKTFVKRGGRHVALEPHKEVPIHGDDVLTFGALKCRITFGAPSETGPPLGSSPPGRTAGQGRAISRAVSIGQRTAAPGSSPAGRSMSLDKCPSLQEWFQHPARSPSGSAGGPQSPFAGVLKARPGGRDGDDGSGSGSRASLDFSSRPSFGFGPTIHEAEEHTSSEPEPETPRIDRPGAPAARSSPQQRPARSPFAGGLAPAEPPEEEEEPEASADTTAEPRQGRSSLELGAATLAGLRAVPLQGSLAGGPPLPPGGSPPGTPGTAELSPAPSRGASPGPPLRPQPEAGGGEDAFRGRPARARPKTPPPKRSRSGRVTSPDKSPRRSKSPRLQRGFELSGLRDGLRDICPDVQQ